MAATYLPDLSPTLRPRSTSDRRRQSSSPWGAFRYGRRRGQRRADGRGRASHADRFTWKALVTALLLTGCTLGDAIGTLYLLDAGCEEVNPAMQFLLDHGVGAFLVGKLALTLVALPVFILYQHHHLFGLTVRVSYIPPALIGLYAILGAYQLSLMMAV